MAPRLLHLKRQWQTSTQGQPGTNGSTHLSACVITGTISGGRPERRAASAAATSACRSRRCRRLSSAAACLLSRAASTCRCQSAAERGGHRVRTSKRPPPLPPSGPLLWGCRLNACEPWA